MSLDSLPSFVEHRINFPIRDGFILTNASVVTRGRNIYAAVCCGDHFMNSEGHYMPYPPGEPFDRHRFSEQTIYLAELDADLNIVGSNEIYLDPANVPVLEGPTYKGFRGFDSARLFVWHSDIWMTMCAMGTGATPEAALFMARIDNQSIQHRSRYQDLRRIKPILPFPTHAEKNWMPEVNVAGTRLRFHYHLGTLADPDGTLTHPGGRADLKQLHGGSQVIPYKDGGLCIAHGFHPRPGTHLRRYLHYFVRTDSNGSPIAISEAFSLCNLQIEIVTGMAYHPDGGTLLISYGREHADARMWDQEFPFIAEISIKDLGRLI